MKKVEGIRSSLAVRIALLFALLILVPLFVHALLLYREEGRQQRQSLFAALELLATEDRAQVEELAVFLQKEALWVFETRRVERVGYKEVFIVENGACTVSTEKSMVGRALSPAQGLQLTRGGILFTSGVGAEATVSFLLDTDDFLARVGQRKNSPFAYDSSIVDEEGAIVASTDRKLLGERFLFQREKGGLALRQLGAERYAAEIELPGSNFSLLVDVPARSTFFKAWLPVGQTALFFSLIVLAGTIIIGWVIFRLARPLQKLGHVMGAIGEGNLDARYQTERLGFEFNQLGLVCNEMVENLLQRTEEVQEEKRAKETLAKELLLGGEVQRSLLEHTAAGFSELDIGAEFSAAREVGGDIYDLFPLGDKLLIVVADAAGKGVHAGFFSLTLRGILRGLAREGISLEALVEKANALFSLDTKESGVFVTAWIGLYEKGQLSYVSCGHPPAFLRRGGNVTRLEAGGMALGVGEFVPEVHELSLEKDDLVLIYTDGVTEAHRDREIFGEQALIAAIGSGNATACTEGVVAAAKAFEGENQHDDQTVVALHLME